MCRPFQLQLAADVSERQVCAQTSDEHHMVLAGSTRLVDCEHAKHFHFDRLVHMRSLLLSHLSSVACLVRCEIQVS